MWRRQNSLNGFKFGTFIGRFPGDGTASMAMKGLKCNTESTSTLSPPQHRVHLNTESTSTPSPPQHWIHRNTESTSTMESTSTPSPPQQWVHLNIESTSTLSPPQGRATSKHETFIAVVWFTDREVQRESSLFSLQFNTIVRLQIRVKNYVQQQSRFFFYNL